MEKTKIKVRLQKVVVCFECRTPIRTAFVTGNCACCLDCCAAVIIAKF